VEIFSLRFEGAFFYGWQKSSQIAISNKKVAKKRARKGRDLLD
jgi:hypothetical protein